MQHVWGSTVALVVVVVIVLQSEGWDRDDFVLSEETVLWMFFRSTLEVQPVTANNRIESAEVGVVGRAR